VPPHHLDGALATQLIETVGEATIAGMKCIASRGVVADVADEYTSAHSCAADGRPTDSIAGNATHVDATSSGSAVAVGVTDIRVAADECVGHNIEIAHVASGVSAAGHVLGTRVADNTSIVKATDPDNGGTFIRNVPCVAGAIDRNVAAPESEWDAAGHDTGSFPLDGARPQVSLPGQRGPPDDFAVAADLEEGDIFSMEALRGAAEMRASDATTRGLPRVMGRELGASLANCDNAKQLIAQCASSFGTPPLLGIATNALFLCHVDASGTAVHVVVQASMSLIASVTSEGAKVMDFALQAEDNHLVTAFDDGCIVVSRLTPEHATPRILLKLEALAARAVAWHPANPRVFFTLQPHRGLLWHVPLIMKFFTLKPLGFDPLEVEGVQTALHVTQGLVQNAAREALPHIAVKEALPERFQTAKEIQGSFAHAALSPDGKWLAASTESAVWLWQITFKDEQALPVATCLQQHVLPDDVNVFHMRLVPRCAPDANAMNVFYILVVVAACDVLLYTLDPCPSGGVGYWLPYGRLLCPLQQRLRFPCSVSADVFLPWDDTWPHAPHATLIVFLDDGEEPSKDAPPALVLTGSLTDGKDNGPIVSFLSAFQVPSVPAAAPRPAIKVVRAFDRSVRARALPEGAESHAWAVVGLAPAAFQGLYSACLCFALPTASQRATLPLDGTMGHQTDKHCHLALEADAATPQVLPIPGFVAPTKALLHSGVSRCDGALVPGGPRNPAQEADSTYMDTDVATPAMFSDVSLFMQKRAHRASDSVLETMKEKLPGAIAASQAGHAGSQSRRKKSRDDKDRDSSTGAQVVLRSLLRETAHITEQAQKAEKSHAAALKTLTDPEALKQVVRSTGMSSIKDSVERELQKCRDGSLSKAVLKTAESKTFSDKFADALQHARLNEAAPLMDALQPSRQQVEEALQTDIHQWCHKLTAKHFKGIFQGGPDGRVRGALDFAMREVTTQSSEALDRLLEQTIHTSNTSELSAMFKHEVVNAVRREVQIWQEDEPAPAPVNGPIAPPAPLGLIPAAEQHTVCDGFAMRLKAAVLPATRDLDSVAKDLALTQGLLQRCRVAADGMDCAEAVTNSAASVAAPGGQDGGDGFAATRAAVLDGISAGRLREGLKTALAWDAKHPEESTSLIELAFHHLRGEPGAASDLLMTEEVLARPEVTSQVTGGLKIALMHELLQRSIIGNAELAQIDANLEWVVGIQHNCDEDDPEITGGLEAARGKMTAALEMLLQGDSPPALAKAADADKKRITLAAKIVLKGLSWLVPARR